MGNIVYICLRGLSFLGYKIGMQAGYRLVGLDGYVTICTQNKKCNNLEKTETYTGLVNIRNGQPVYVSKDVIETRDDGIVYVYDLSFS